MLILLRRFCSLGGSHHCWVGQVFYTKIIILKVKSSTFFFIQNYFV
jgi:hypothetical protein